MTTQASLKKPKPEVFVMRIIKGGMEPNDGYTHARLRARNYAMGDLVFCTFKKPNNPKFHRLIHRIGQLCAANIEAFSGMEAHDILKRIQVEADIACEPVAVTMRQAWAQFSKAILGVDGMFVIEPALDVVGAMLPEDAMIQMRVPQSLSFSSMDDGQRHEVARAICRYISMRYWKDLSPEQIEEMAESWVGEN